MDDPDLIARQAEACAPAIEALKADSRVKADTVGIWHTGGGCYAVGADLLDGREILIGDGNADVPEVAEGPWYGQITHRDQRFDGCGYNCNHATGHATAHDMLECLLARTGEHDF